MQSFMSLAAAETLVVSSVSARLLPEAMMRAAVPRPVVEFFFV
jgi:hypothetical protein